MRHILLILAAILAPVAMFGAVVFAAYAPGLPSEAKQVLAEYVAFRSNESTQLVQKAVSHAAYPRRFTAAESSASFGSGDFFDTTYVPDARRSVIVPRPDETTPLTAVVQSDTRAASGRQPLFPPTDLWCVTLTDSAEGPSWVVLVAEHEDMYVARWVVYELGQAASASEIQVMLRNLGCRAS
jgi:hypothetical protein